MRVVAGLRDSALILVRPDGALRRVGARRDALAAGISLGIANGAMALFLAVWFTQRVVPIRVISVSSGAAMVVFSAAAGIFLCAGASLLLDALYCVALKINGRPLVSDRLAHWCCRACLTPWWMTVAVLAVWLPALRDVPFSGIFLAVVLIRLLDVEARLLRQVYRMRLRQAYEIVVMEVVCVGTGALIGTRLPPTAISMPHMSF